MKADPILLQMKYARVVGRFADRCGITLGEALDFFYHSDEYTLVSQGISDMHCMSDEYLAEDLENEYRRSRNFEASGRAVPCRSGAGNR